MPPKGTQEKVKQAARQKAVEDATFGLKNKNKSAKVQQYVTQLKQQASAGSSKEARMAQQKAEEKKRLAEEKKRAEEEMAKIMRAAVVQPKLAPGVDPKSVVCEFWRVGQCQKGNKCKYAHDLGVERKGPKINIYEDEAEGKEGGMEDWTQEELEKAVAQKHGQENKNNATTIVCKFFIEAVEKRQYGWFWQCPNGGKNCQYRHALPPGFVLPSQMKAMLAEEAEKSRDVTDIIEEERSKCDASTRITEEVFLQWRKRKDEERAKKEEEKKAERAKAGKVSGREMFQTEGFVVTDDDGAAAGDGYAREFDEEANARRAEAEARERETKARETGGLPPEGAEDGAAAASPSEEAAGDEGAGEDRPGPSLAEDEEEELFGEDDDEDLDLDELEEELEAKASVA